MISFFAAVGAAAMVTITTISDDSSGVNGDSDGGL